VFAQDPQQNKVRISRRRLARVVAGRIIGGCGSSLRVSY
jgi:hypothetical protein